MHREDQHLGAGDASTDLPGRLDAVHDWQRVVEHHHLWASEQRQFESFRPVLGLCDDFPAWLSFQNAPHARAHDIVVVRDQDARHSDAFRRALSDRSRILYTDIIANLEGRWSFVKP